MANHMRFLSFCVAWLAADAGALLQAQASETVAQQAEQPRAQASEAARPALQPRTQPQLRAIAPRPATTLTPPETLTLAQDEIQATLQSQPSADTVYEAEAWGERPDLGMTVQDMTGFGSGWSGNKQIFWNPQAPHRAFQLDYVLNGADAVQIFVTRAPDYAELDIRLGCYKQVSANFYQFIAQRQRTFDGYASTVHRTAVFIPISSDPQCKNADLVRLTVTAEQSPGRTFGGIDSIVLRR